MIRELNQDEAAALQAFAAKHGRSWKDKLAGVYWYNARVWNWHACLHALRNDPSWGHEGLQAYRLPKPETTFRDNGAALWKRPGKPVRK